jgi:hypothetical protein
MKNKVLLFSIVFISLVVLLSCDEDENVTLTKLTHPPDALQLNPFYQKYLDASGIPVVSSSKVPDQALYNAKKVINMMVSLRNDILMKMIENKARVAVMSQEEVVTDMPEYNDLDNLYPGRDWNQHRGLGGTINIPLILCAEENVLCYGLGKDVHAKQDILIHEFAHGMHLLGIAFIDLDFNFDLEQALNNAKTNGLWQGTYASTNSLEYFAEGVGIWFNANPQPVLANGVYDKANTRDELRTYDIGLYNIIKRYLPETSETVSCHQ